MTVHVQVTAEDIQKGYRANCELCPIALAMSRVLERRCYVGNDSVWIDGQALQAPLPESVIQQRRAFDLGNPMQPFEFEIDLQEVTQ